MSLRTRLLALFGALAVAPLTALGVFDYFRSEHAVERLLTTQTSALAERIAHQATGRIELLRGDLELLANNEDTRRFLSTGRDREAAERFLASVLGAATMPEVSLLFRDSARREVLRLAPGPADGLRHDAALHSMTLEMVGDGGQTLGSMTATLPVERLLPRAALEEHVGIHGYSVLVDRTSRRILADPDFPAGPERGLAAIAATAGPVRYAERDSTRIGTLVPVGSDGLAVLSAASLEEYSAPLASLRGTNLLLALLATAALALAFLLLTRKVTRPLESLTLAADAIGRGNFASALPAAAPRDEVGRLTAAFGRMSNHIREMLAQLESSRQMAAVGAFASQISHEIRNPLTSIKLNLQSLQRDRTDARALEICLAEIQRLDGVVRGVLRLAREHPREAKPMSVHAILDDAVALMTRQLEGQGIAVRRALAAGQDVVVGDAAELRGAVLNLLVNAADALPRGGEVRVSTSQSGGVRPGIRIAVDDSGLGVPVPMRDAIFQAFVTTKASGNGLGLALASRDLERHGGRLTLAEGPGELGGASFVIELPLADDGAPP